MCQASLPARRHNTPSDLWTGGAQLYKFSRDIQNGEVNQDHGYMVLYGGALAKRWQDLNLSLLCLGSQGWYLVCCLAGQLGGQCGDKTGSLSIPLLNCPTQKREATWSSQIIDVWIACNYSHVRKGAKEATAFLLLIVQRWCIDGRVGMSANAVEPCCSMSTRFG